MYTTLNQIRAHSPCQPGWEKLLRSLGKTQADDEPLAILSILESNGLDDAIWCLRAVEGRDSDIRKLACAFALQAADLWDMPPVVRTYLETQDESLREEAEKAAQAAARAARDAAGTAAWAARAAMAAASAAAWAAAQDAAGAAARAAAADSAKKAAIKAAQETELRRICTQL